MKLEEDILSEATTKFAACIHVMTSQVQEGKVGKIYAHRAALLYLITSKVLSLRPSATYKLLSYRQ